MNSSNKVACPLDCFDTCEAVLIEGKIRANKEHFTTRSKLCVNFAHLLNERFLDKAYVNKDEVSLSKALSTLVDKLKTTPSSKTLYYKGSGNLGVMQSSPKKFFEAYGSVFTKGSLCEGAGDKGIVMGRGKNVNPPIEKLLNADVIIVWGRNFSVTSAHMYDLVKDKTFITIDPMSTPIAKKSDVHLQINPKTDHELALLLTRFAYMDDMEDESFIQECGSGADWFFDLAKSRPLVSYENTIGVCLKDVAKVMEIIKDKSVAIMMGIGVQKYYEGANIVRAIDSFAAYIGVHNKQAGGVWYLGDSGYSYESKFAVNPAKRVSLPEVNFSDFDVVFIQGANPVVSAPNTKRVIEGLKNTFVVYFGTTLNDTCEYANIIIPSTNFKAKKDVRLSYGHEYKALSYAIETKQNNSLSEYEFLQFMNEQFGFDALESEEEIVAYYANKSVEDHSSLDRFEFLEDLEINSLYEGKKEDEYYFLYMRRKENLNSQFIPDNHLYMHPHSSYEEGSEVRVRSLYGEAVFIVKHSSDLKEDCIATYSGNRMANYLTSHKSDEEASSAIFQDLLVTVELS